MRDTLKIEADFDAQHSESPQYPAAKAYLSCVRQLAIEGCPDVETLDALSEVYKRAFRRCLHCCRVQYISGMTLKCVPDF